MPEANPVTTMELSFEKRVEANMKTLAEMMGDRKDTNPDSILASMRDNYNATEFETHWKIGQDKYAMKIINRKLTTINKMPDIKAFTDTYASHHKFLVVADKTKNIETQIKAIPSIELFTIDELLVNISRHILVPKHRLLQEDKKEQLLKEYSLVPSKLPKMYDTDPMARYVGAQSGDIIEIVRTSLQSGYVTMYRLVVPDPGN